jgi:hypothetical protein
MWCGPGSCRDRFVGMNMALIFWNSGNQEVWNWSAFFVFLEVLVIMHDENKSIRSKGSVYVGSLQSFARYSDIFYFSEWHNFMLIKCMLIGPK